MARQSSLNLDADFLKAIKFRATELDKTQKQYVTETLLQADKKLQAWFKQTTE